MTPPPVKPKMTWANRITIVRLLLTPVFVIGLLTRSSGWPALIFFLAALTDILDGAVARARGEQTTLGKYLDPIADKLLISSSYLALAHIDVLPMWIFVVVFSRDLLILLGWNVVYILTRNSTPRPRWLGKITTFWQMATVVVVLLFPGTVLVPLMIWPMTAVTALSTIDYVWVGAQTLSELG